MTAELVFSRKKQVFVSGEVPVFQRTREDRR
jgi:hypothetical protein